MTRQHTQLLRDANFKLAELACCTEMTKSGLWPENLLALFVQDRHEIDVTVYRLIRDTWLRL